jgi:hypothetical protein
VLLYHFSEDPDIIRFEPRAPLERPHIEPMVWAIDEWHAPMYFLPRDCPRACFWPADDTADADRTRWFGDVGARMVIAIEAAWLPRVRSTVLYRYTMPPASFVLNDAVAGHYVAYNGMDPLSVEPVGDLLEAMAAAGAHLRAMPGLGALWHGIVTSTLAFSGTRLRNAVGYPEEFPPATA